MKILLIILLSFSLYSKDIRIIFKDLDNVCKEKLTEEDKLSKLLEDKYSMLINPSEVNLKKIKYNNIKINFEKLNMKIDKKINNNIKIKFLVKIVKDNFLINYCENKLINVKIKLYEIKQKELVLLSFQSENFDFKKQNKLIENLEVLNQDLNNCVDNVSSGIEFYYLEISKNNVFIKREKQTNLNKNLEKCINNKIRKHKYLKSSRKYKLYFSIVIPNIKTQ